jgi:hypothetical protein
MKRIAIFGLVAFATSAAAADPVPDPAQAGATPESQVNTPFGTGSRIGTSALAAITGREDTTMIIRANNTSTVSGNSVVGQSQTGMVNFDGQAFGNLSGLSLVSANTGNNVSINSSMNLNVAIRP